MPRKIIPPRIPEIHSDELEQIYIRHHRLYYHTVEGRDLRAAKALKTLTKLESGVILDVACGCGGFTCQLAKVFPGVHVIGVDLSQPSIAVATEMYGSQANLEFAVTDAYDLAADYQHLDLVTIVDSLHHFDDLDALFAQISRALKPGRFFFIEDLNRARILEQLDAKSVRAVAKLRANHSDRRCLQLLARSGQVDTQSMEFVMLLSFMAAYTPSRVEAALKGKGFRGSVREPEKGKYVALVINGGSQSPERASQDWGA